MSLDRTLLIATTNAGKVTEFRQMLDTTGIDVVGLDAFAGIREVEETGSTFAENARQKAIGYAAQAGIMAIADDSGLEVTALDGHPGIQSARYGGDDLAFPAKIRKLLAELDATGTSDRSARFVCSIALASPQGEIIAKTEGVCTGKIASAPRGTGGFGYDPVFVPDGYDLTFGELPGAVKAQISHRGRAFLQIMPILRRFYGILT